MLEILEDRLAPANVSWDGGAGTLAWNDAANWDTNSLPGLADDVFIGSDFAGTTITSAANVTVRRISSEAIVQVNSGILRADAIQANKDLVLNGGTIAGATIALPPLISVIGASGMLDGVTVNGDLKVGATTSGFISIQNGLTLNGTATLGNGSIYGYLNFRGTQTIGGNGVVVLISTGNQTGLRIADAGTTLTIASTVTVRGREGFIGYNPNLGGTENVTFINQGTIRAEISGAPITLRAATWESNGAIDATVGMIRLYGAVANANRTLTLAGTGFEINALSITCGTVATSHSVDFSGATLDGVTVNGNFSVGTTVSGYATIRNGLTVNGTATLGNGSRYGYLVVRP